MTLETNNGNDRQDSIDRMEAESAVRSHFQHVITSDRGKLGIYSWLDRLAKGLVTEANSKPIKKHFSCREAKQRILSSYLRLAKIDPRTAPDERKNASFAEFVTELENATVQFSNEEKEEVKIAIGLCIDQLAHPGSMNRELMQFDFAARR
jgi:hypothetical protein